MKIISEVSFALFKLHEIALVILNFLLHLCIFKLI